jgi:hypothetical protein
MRIVWASKVISAKLGFDVLSFERRVRRNNRSR